MNTTESVVDALRQGLGGRDRYYARLHALGQARGGVYFDPVLQGHVVVGYRACEALYRDPAALGRSRMALDERLFDGAGDSSPRRGLAVLQAMSIFVDPGSPGFAARRQRLLAWIARGAGAHRQPSVQALADASVQQLPAGRSHEVFATSLRPFANACASWALGLDPAAGRALLDDALALAAFFDGKRPQPAQVLAALAATDRLARCLAEALQLDPRDDADCVADLVLVFVAAHESMAYLLYTAQVECVAAGGALPAADAVGPLLHEALRIDSPVQMSGRVALQALPCGQATVQPGERVYLHVGAANRDPQRFDEPAQFRPGRGTPQLGFGWGLTRCVGAEHAMRCAGAYLHALSRRFERLQHAPERTRFDHGLAARGLRETHFTYH